jgi:hypothetical protein
VSHIVALESGEAHDVERSIDRLDFKVAEGSILSSRDVNNVVISRDLEVVLLNAEVKVGEVCGVAIELRRTTFDGVVNADSCEELLHNTFEPKLGDVDVRGRDVENGVQASFTIRPNTCSIGRPGEVISLILSELDAIC